MKSRLYIGNLPWTASEDDVRSYFAGISPTFVKVVTDKDTGRSRGFAFIETIEDADDVIAQYNSQDFGGRKLVVNVANERKRAG